MAQIIYKSISQPVHHHRCECREQYTGELCETPLDFTCSVSLCQNGGTCIQTIEADGTQTSRCACEQDYVGKTCETSEYLYIPTTMLIETLASSVKLSHDS